MLKTQKLTNCAGKQCIEKLKKKEKLDSLENHVQLIILNGSVPCTDFVAMKATGTLMKILE